jgi:antitoxin VapB
MRICRKEVGLNIKNQRVESLAAEVAELAGETKTEAVRKALEERRARLASGRLHRNRASEVMRFLEREVWPKVPRRLLGRGVSRRERERILGDGPQGV